MSSITLFRLDHREIRDQRITSHVALTARAMGCTSFWYSGEYDSSMEQSIGDVALRWGGDYKVSYKKSIKSTITNFEGIKVHLTMYGEDHRETLNTLKDLDEPLLIIVGGAKVPRYVYSIVDFNTAVGWQPHSEVAATAVFLENLQGSDQMYKSHPNASITIDGTSSKSGRSNRFSQ